MTIIELMIALMILTIAVAGLAYTDTLGMVDTAYATQRQSATGLANQAIEQVRALPFSTVAAGLSTCDPTFSTDPNITTAPNPSGSGTIYEFNGEEIPVYTPAAASCPGTVVAPLNPHVVSGIRVGTNTYTVSTYITYAQGPPPLNTPSAPSSVPVFRATAVVTWVNPQRHGLVPQVQNQTLIYSPNGCQSNATHPYTAPCQPFFYANASNGGASEVVSGPGGASPISGIANLAQASLFPTNNRTESQIEQISTVRSYAQTTSGLITYSDGTPQQDASSQAASAAASNDSTSSLGPYQSSSTSQSASTVTASSTGSPASLSVSPSPSDAGSAVATVSATSSQPCANISGNPVTTSQPCGNSTITQAGGPGTIALNWTPSGPNGLSNPNLVSIGVPPSASVAATEHDTTPGTSTCTQVPPNSDGCLYAGARRSLGTVDLGELPSGLPLPSGWNISQGLVELTGFSDSVSAEAGVGAGAPQVQAAGSIVYYDAASGTYKSLAVDSSPAGTLIPVQPVTVDDPTYPGGGVQVTITPDLTFGGISANDPAAGCASPCTRNQASATSLSPIRGTIEYQVIYNGLTIVDAIVAVDLGDLSATATYQAAPSSAP